MQFYPIFALFRQFHVFNAGLDHVTSEPFKFIIIITISMSVLIAAEQH